MQVPAHANWYDGERAPAREGIEWRYRPHGQPDEALALFPRSSAADARAALMAAERGAAVWADLPRADRVRRVRALQAALDCRSPETQALELTLAFGLEDPEARSWVDQDALDLATGFEIAADSRGEARGPGLFLAHWSERVGPLSARLCAELLSGRVAILIVDARFPFAGLAWIEAAERAELPRGALGVLYDDGTTAAESLLAEPALGWARLCGLDERLERLAARSHDRLELSLRRAATHTALVHADQDPRAAAADILRTACSRSATLSGQLPGQIGRVLCHERVFSAFTEALLGELERSDDLRRPLPCLELDGGEHLNAAWALGLDAGATPLWGDVNALLSWARSSWGGGSGAAPPNPPDGRGWPLVFTNVEPHQRLARLGRPQPVLALLRVDDPGRARGLALELDRRRG